MTFQEITQFEKKLYNNGIKYIAGIDEVGRGPLAGPFVVSAVMLDLEKIFNKEMFNLLENNGNDQKIDTDRNNDFLYTRIRDSKKVSSNIRNILANFIKKEAISYSIEVFEPKEVDKMGISELTQLAFSNSVKNLKIKPQYILTDTFEIRSITKEHQLNIVSGDNKSISIASASIIAKVYRDNIMIEMHKKYPIYGFDQHKGYGTKHHIEALHKHGPCEIHRKSFEPLKTIIREVK